MPLFFRFARFLQLRVRGWRLPLAVALVVFTTSWPLMALAEPAGSELVGWDTFWWYFIVTSSTVGYGDFFPTTTAGRLVGVYVIVGGIVTLTLLFTRLADALQALRSKRAKGVVTLELSDHVVLLGYFPGRTERLVAELTAEDRQDVVLCAWDDVLENPLPETQDLHFVRGDLTHDDVMHRARVDRARTVVVDARDDNEALAVAVAVDHANPRVHLVVALRDLSRRDTLRYVNPGVQVVQWHMPYLLTEEANDPGITQIYSELMTEGGTGNTYSLRVPRDVPHATFGELQSHFGRTWGATVLAVRDPEGLDVCPSWDRPVDEGATVYYVARERIDARRLAAGR